MRQFLKLLMALAVFREENAIAFEQRNAKNVPVKSNRGESRIPVAPGGSIRMKTGMAPLRQAHSRLPHLSIKTRVQQSTVPIEYQSGKRMFRWSSTGTATSASASVSTTPQRTNDLEIPTVPRTYPISTSVGTATLSVPVETSKKQEAVKKKGGISKLDVVLFMTYFCNMFVVNLSVVTIPALAAGSLSNAAASAAFESKVASMAPLGGAFGKIINGFVCQKLGGRTSSCLYLLGLATLSGGLSFTTSLASVGYILMGYEFLSSIQWTSMCSVLDEKHEGNTSKIARGIAILSLSSYCGALAAKTLGATLLNLTGNWRHVTRYGVLAALLGSLSMFGGISPSKAAAVKQPSKDKETDGNPLGVLKSILTSRLFWMVGIGHSLGYIVRSSDRLLVPFLHQATGFPRHICASLTSSVTIGFVLGLGRGTIFTQLDSIKDKLTMLKRNYVNAIVSFFGLALCALNVLNGWFNAPMIMAGIISLLSGIAASSISFQFSQVPNLVSSNVFPENKSVALSLVDAAGFFVTSQVLSANSKVLSTLGWSSSWTFLALFLGLGSTLMVKNIEPILLEEKKRG